MTLIVLPGKITDAENCAKIVNYWIKNTSWMPCLYSQSELSLMIKEAIPKREFWVVNRPAIGYLSFDIRLSQVVALYSRAPGKGIGKLLLDHIKTRYKNIHLWSHSANKEAHKFYYREGFRLVDFKEVGQELLR